MKDCKNMDLLKRIELREYQEKIVNSILERGNTLVVLPTGTGKTIIAFYVIVCKGSGLFLAPTKPLVKQHYENFVSLFPELKERAAVITGEIRKEKRKNLYKKDFVFATPQTVASDLDFLEEKEVYVFDECHRAVGDYAYVKIVKRIDDLIIGLTASPGGKEEKIREVIQNLKIGNIEVRTGEEEDIKPYLFKKKKHWVFVSLTPSLKRAVGLIKDLLKEYVDWFKNYNIRIKLTKSELLRLREKINNLEKPFVYTAASNFAILFNLNYMLEILETQGFHYFLHYVKELSKKPSKTGLKIINNPAIKKVISITLEEVKKGEYHPKFYKLKESLEKNRGKKIIVFVQYVYTINLLYEWLKKQGFFVLRFVGKRSGYNKKEQDEVIKIFRERNDAILLSSSVGEEGIDIPYVDVVVFFDVVPSEIRSIQRKGRAGRFREGEIYYIITSNTRELAFYRAAVKREKLMYFKLKELGNKLKLNKIGLSKREEKKKEEKGEKGKGQLRISDFLGD